MVGCQADVKFSKGSLDSGNYIGLATEYEYKGKEYLEKRYSVLKELMIAERFSSAKIEANQWVEKDGNTTEFNAFVIAYCQLRMGEFNDCIETCTALIDFHGDYFKQAYLFRGLAKESIIDFQDALVDYDNSGEIGVEAYNELIKKINAINDSQLQKSSKNGNSNKPQLRK